MPSLNFKNSIDHLISIEINEEENKNAATKKSLNRSNLKNVILYTRNENLLNGLVSVAFDELRQSVYGKEYSTVISTRS